MPLFFTSFRFALAGRGRPNVRAGSMVKSWNGSRFQWVMVAALLAIAIAYIVEMNFVTMRGYDVQRLEAKRRELLETKTALTVEVTAVRTLPMVQERINEHSFVKAEKGTYLTTRDSTLVQK